MKKIKMQKQNTSLLKEIVVLKDLDHPNIIKLFTSFVEGDSLYLILELAKEGDLLRVIEN
jgi:serine/threonine protein kinase